MLAGSNDVDLLERTNNGRDINRHYYSLEEFEKELDRHVVRRLFELMKFRNNYPAFDGSFELLHSDVSELHLKWQNDDLYCIAKIDLKKHTVSVEYVDELEKKSVIRSF